MTNILYIHGYGSNANSSTGQEIRKNLSPDITVFTHSFSNDYDKFDVMSDNIKQAQELINDMNINLVVASSMGGFIAMACIGVPKILINPCMLPSEQLKRRIAPEIADLEVQKYQHFEALFTPNSKERRLTFGLFSTHDELFSYKNLFEAKYGPDYSFTMVDCHRISPESIRNELIPLINKIIRSALQ